MTVAVRRVAINTGGGDAPGLNAVIRAVKEGRLLYRDAYRLTGLHGKTFDRYAVLLGFRP